MTTSRKGGKPTGKILSAKSKTPVPAAGDRILGDHPGAPHPFATTLTAADGRTDHKVPHRVLTEANGSRSSAIKGLRTMLMQHHASPEALERSAQQRKAMEQLGLGTAQARLRRFPSNSATQKGNLAEIVLAEYVVAAGGLALPVYRLRYNPNVDQSMKGDDVLAFDLDSNPVRIVVGEAKFRGVSSAAAVTEIVESLVRSHKAGVPASLQFVADRLFEDEQVDLGIRVMECALLFARGKLRLDYVGLLLSDAKAAARVNASTPATKTRLAMISLGIDDPDGLVTSCYQGLE
jgi:hypothetical protein